MRLLNVLFFAVPILFLAACQPDNDPFDDQEGVTPNLPDIDPGQNPGNDPEVDDFQVAELGRLLFWDPILSGEKDVACVSCHHPNFGYADGRDLPIGVGGQGLGPDRRDVVNDDIGLVGRNSPTILNTAFNGMDENGNFDPARAPMFWDNRAQSLESQALMPLLSFEEMRGHAFGEDVTIDSIVTRLRNNDRYPDLFVGAFGNGPITSVKIGAAIAAFERTILARNSAFDRFQNGQNNAMTPAQIRGMNRFNAIGCDDCHSGPMFSDFQLHTLGVPDNNLLTESDAGANGDYEFRTPSLRNLPQTGPYFHNGVGRTLQQTVAFYVRARNFANGNNGNNGGGPGALDINPNVNRNDIAREVRDLGPINPNDIQDIVQFLQALNDTNFDREIPDSVPSGLNPGGNIN